MPNFADVVDAVDELSLEEQETLIAIFRRRIAERNRARIVRSVSESRAEFANGNAHSASVKEIMAEVTGEP